MSAGRTPPHPAMMACPRRRWRPSAETDLSGAQPPLVANHPRSPAESCATTPASCRAALACGCKVLDQSCARRLSGGGRFKMALRLQPANRTSTIKDRGRNHATGTRFSTARRPPPAACRGEDGGAARLAAVVHSPGPRHSWAGRPDSRSRGWAIRHARGPSSGAALAWVGERG